MQKYKFKSTETGSGHWLQQRLTAILLIILTGWLVYFSRIVSQATQIDELIIILKTPYHLAGLTLFLIISLYHACLGMRVIIEDYVHHNYSKIVLLFLVNSLSVMTILLFFITIIKIMII